MFMLVFAAIGVFGAGMLAIAAGIPIKEFGFGNTLILSGVLAWCTSAIMVTLWACFRELRQAQGERPRSARARESEDLTLESRPALPQPPATTSGWPESIPERPSVQPAPPAAPAPAPAAPREPRRNLLFASNRAPRDASAATEASSAPAPLDVKPALVEEPRPAPRRSEPPARPARPVSTVGPRDPVSAPPPPPPPPPPVEASPPQREPEPAASPRNGPGRSETSAVSVLKSGVVDGMAYWLYSDGSIEAQMPEGMMRFTSIDELRAHLDKRP